MIKGFLYATVMLAAIAGCKSENCSCPTDTCNSCSSTSPANAAIPVPVDAAGVESVTADNSCSAMLQADLDRVLVSHLGPGSCTVRILLSGGGVEVAQVGFTAVSGACGCYLAGNVSSLESTDAASPSL
jgi:hypothetical protein